MGNRLAITTEIERRFLVDGREDKPWRECQSKINIKQFYLDSVALEINQARQDAAKLIEQTNRELEAQKSLALQQLETQVDELSQLIKEKLLGKEVVL